jgi:probable HAF family extracellular repeat protein
MIYRPGLIKYLGISFAVVFFLFGCSSGGGDTDAGGGGGGTTGSGSTVIPAQGTVAPPGTLGPLVDIGDLVNDGENWYETRVMGLGENDNVVGQTTVAGGPVKGAYLWDENNVPPMTFLGIHGQGGLAGVIAYNNGELVADPTKEVNPFRYSEAVAVGPNGEVICNSTTGTDWPDEKEKRAFYWNGVTQIDLPPDESDADPAKWGQFSEAFDINSDIITFSAEYLEKGGDILAFGYAINNVSRPAFPDYAAGDIFGLAQIIGAGIVEPVDINNNNEAITNSVDTTVVFDDLISAGIADLGALAELTGLAGGQATVGAAINDHPGTGYVAGTTGNKAFFWNGGSMVSCGDLGGGTSEATDLNDPINPNIKAQVVGNSTTASGDTHAFVWQLNASGHGVMTDLGTLGGANSWAVDINNNGLIVGRAETGATYTEGGLTYNVVHACAWYNNVIYDLGIHSNFYAYDLANPFPFSEAIAVNENNRIAGNSYSPNEHYRGFVLDAVLP